MKKLNLPPIGARTLKTGLSVFLCILFFEIIQRPYPFYACIAAVICLKETVETSMQMGKNRIIGTLIGGMIGLILTFIVDTLNLTPIISIITAIGVILSIYICNLLKKNASVSISCIVIIAIMVNLKTTISYDYAINRMIDTFIGIILAILVNKYVYPYDKSKTIEKK